MKPIFFLDIDGVLATDYELFDIITKDFMNDNTWAKELNVPYPFNKDCVNAFNNILINTDAEIVLSSDWKIHWTLEQLNIIFKENGVIKSPIDITSKKRISYTNYEKDRAYQIEKYIKDNNIEKYVIVDDMLIDIYFYTSKEKFVRTDSLDGINNIDVKNKILKILQK